MRFSLKKLLALVTVVAVLLGAQQIHRQRIMRKVEEFRAAGAEIEFDKSWRNVVWLHLPEKATIKVTLTARNRFSLGEHDYPTANTDEVINGLTARLNEAGISKVDTVLFTRFKNTRANRPY